MQHDDGRVVDIVLAADEIAEYIRAKTYQDYLDTSLLRAGVERQVYIIGEASRQLTEAFRIKHPTVPWTRIIGARNVLAHEYGKVKHEILWEIATVHVPALATYLRPHMPPEIE